MQILALIRLNTVVEKDSECLHFAVLIISPLLLLEESEIILVFRTFAYIHQLILCTRKKVRNWHFLVLFLFCTDPSLVTFH